MKAVLLTNVAGNQQALANKLSKVCDLTAIVLSENVPKKKKTRAEQLRLRLNALELRAVGRPFIRAWRGMLSRYSRLYPELPRAEIVRVRNVNDKATLDALEAHAPDVVIVSGTNLVGAGVVKSAQRHGHGILNMHTGISPYIKGGPNCTNWCLADGLFHLIGTTVMWLDLGIDTGAIIATERAPLDGSESLEEMHWRVMEHAHDLYVRCVGALGEGRELPRIPQDTIAEGRTYYTREWSALPVLRARRNFRKWSRELVASRAFQERCDAVRLFPMK